MGTRRLRERLNEQRENDRRCLVTTFFSPHAAIVRPTGDHIDSLQAVIVTPAAR